MKEINTEQAKEIGGGLEPRQYETQVAPEPTTTDPLIVVDYPAPIQPQ